MGSCFGFSFLLEARRYVRSTWNWSQVGSKIANFTKGKPLPPSDLKIHVFEKIASWTALGSFLVPSGLDFEGSGVNFFDIFV